MSGHSITTREYLREMPGGGFVAIDVTAAHTLFHGVQYSAALIVERRSDLRRSGQRPPVLARVAGSSAEAVLEQLLPTAQYDPALASALLRISPAPRIDDRMVRQARVFVNHSSTHPDLSER